MGSSDRSRCYTTHYCHACNLLLLAKCILQSWCPSLTKIWPILGDQSEILRKPSLPEGPSSAWYPTPSPSPAVCFCRSPGSSTRRFMRSAENVAINSRDAKERAKRRRHSPSSRAWRITQPVPRKLQMWIKRRSPHKQMRLIPKERIELTENQRRRAAHVDLSVPKIDGDF